MVKIKLKFFYKRFLKFIFFRYFSFGLLTGFLIFAICVIKYPSQSQEWFRVPLITGFYNSLLSQLNKLLPLFYLSQFPKMFLIIILYFLITRNWIDKIFAIWSLFFGIIMWLLLQGYNPGNYFFFNLNRDVFRNLFIRPENLSLGLFFNVLSLILGSFLAIKLSVRFGKFALTKIGLQVNKLAKKEKPKFYLVAKKWLIKQIGLDLKVDIVLRKIKNEQVIPQLSDNPLESVDDLNHIREVSGEKDLFTNFEQNINALFSLINERRKHTEEGVQAICLDGSWGSGKTSLVNITLGKITKDIVDLNTTKDICWVKFNPWSYNSGDELINDFFKTLDFHLRDKFGEYLEPYFNQYVELITPLTESVGIPKSIGESLKKFLFFDNGNLDSIKSSIRKRLEKIDGEIVIIIDDVDRLYYDEAILVLKLVRQNFNFSNLLFILPFDYERVAELIMNQPGNCELYREYLQKIINFRLKLNKYSYKELQSIFVTCCLDKIKSLNLDEKILTKEKIIKNYESYVMERSKHAFKGQRYKQDQSGSGSETLKPIFSFYEPIFEYFFDDYSYNGEYEGQKLLRDDITYTIMRHSSGECSDLEALINNIYNPVRLQNRRKLDIQDKINDFSNDIKLADGDRNNLKVELQQIAQDVSLDGDKFSKAIKDFLDNFKASKISSLGDSDKENKFDSFSGLILEVINSHIRKFERPKYADDVDLVKNWLVSNLTPRDVKQLAQKLLILSVSDLGNENKVKKTIKEVALQHSLL